MTATTITVTIAATTKTEPASIWGGLGWLYAIQAANLALPLLSVPYLARTLGASAWGRIAAAQAFAMLAGLIVEFGFNISAARMVARRRSDPLGLGRTFAAVGTAQALLLTVAILLAVAIRPAVPYLAEDAGLFWAAMVWMVPQMVSFQWYYQGIERMPQLAGLIFAGRLAGLAGVLILVQGPADATLSLLVPGLTGAAAMVIAGGMPWYRLGPAAPDAAEIWEVLRAGWSLCCYRAGIALQGAANSFLLAFFLAPALVGAYAGADRLVRAASGFLEPLVLIVFPRLARLHASDDPEDRDAAQACDRVSFRWMVIAGGLIAVLLCATAPWLVALLLGPGFESSTPVLRLLALSPLAGVLCQGRGLNGLAARGEDGTLNRVVLAAGGLQISVLFLVGWLATSSPLHWIAGWTVAAQLIQWLWLERASGRSRLA